MRLAALGAALIALIIALISIPAGVGHAQGAARAVEGVIVNGTAGGGDVSGQTVTLHQVSADGFRDVTTTSEADGSFRFEGIEYDPTLAYGVSARYQDAIYGTDLDLSAGSPEMVTLTVYEATHDDTVVSAESASLLLASADQSAQTLAALEIVRLVNRSDTAYVPGSGVMELLRFGLPPGATELTLDTQLIGADFVQVDRGFALLASVPPGEYEVMFSYKFPYEAERFTLAKTYRYGADSLRVLAPEEVVTIASAELGAPSAVTIGERQYQTLEGEGLARGATVSLHLADLPTATAGQRIGGRLSNVRFEYAAPVGLGVLMAGLLAYGAIWKSGRRGPAHPPDEDEKAIIRQMIEDLAASYESGALSESDYRRRLRVLNSRLTALAHPDSA